MITPIRCAVDTLEATFQGEIDPIVLDLLADKKRAAQATGDPQAIRIGEEELFVLPKGGGLWAYLLKNDDLLVWVSGAKNIPPMKVRLLAEGLASVGVEALWSRARSVGSAVGLFPWNCTRIDVACDFQGWAPTVEEMRHVVCPASFRPIYPSLDNPETYQFGQGECVVRVYDKLKEVRARKKRFWEIVWRGLDRYTEGEGVWRAEVQLRGSVLRELGMKSVEQTIENTRGLFEFGMEWCSLRTPTSDSNPSRWPRHECWAYLVRFYMPGEPLTRVRPARTLMEYDAAVERFLSLVASVGASVESDDYWHVAEILSTDAEQYLERELQTTFGELVEKRRRRRHL